MKIVYLTTGYQCGHDYGVDNLFTGFVNVLGWNAILNWPEKAPLHCPVAERTHFDVPQRDACQIDSDAAYPLRGTTAFDLLDADVALIAMPPYCPDAGRAAEVCRALPSSTLIAAIDASDRVEDHSDWYERVAGRSLAAYFKREYPSGTIWPNTYALPLSYPASRVPTLNWDAKRLRIFYHATSHNGQSAGVPRLDILAELERLANDEDDARLDICLTPTQENRDTPEQYHAGMARSLLGLSWNGADNWDCNRFWENFAYGLCQVAERPRIQIPDMPLDGVHCFYANTPEEVAGIAWTLLKDESLTRRIALNGHAHFLEHHSSEARARVVLDVLGQIGG